MTELLSSDEIDTLLHLFRQEGGEGNAVDGAITASPMDAEAIDLLAPNRIGHGELGFLDRLLGETARSIGAELARQVGRPLRGECESVEAIRWATWRSGFRQPALLFEVALDPLLAPACFELPRELVHGLVELSLGGSSESAPDGLGFTPAEIAVVAGLMHAVGERLAVSFRALAPLQARVLGHSTDPALLTKAPLPDTFVLAAVLRITGCGDEHRIRLSLPQTDLDPLLLRDMDARRAGSAPGQGRLRPTLTQVMRDVRVPIRVELGRSATSLRALLALAVGDVVQLRTRVGAALDVRVGPGIKLQGVLGRDGQTRAVCIQQVVTEEQHDQQ